MQRQGIDACSTSLDIIRPSQQVRIGSTSHNCRSPRSSRMTVTSCLLSHWFHRCLNPTTHPLTYLDLIWTSTIHSLEGYLSDWTTAIYSDINTPVNVHYKWMEQQNKAASEWLTIMGKCRFNQISTTLRKWTVGGKFPTDIAWAWGQDEVANWELVRSQRRSTRRDRKKDEQRRARAERGNAKNIIIT